MKSFIAVPASDFIKLVVSLAKPFGPESTDYGLINIFCLSDNQKQQWLTNNFIQPLLCVDAKVVWFWLLVSFLISTVLSLPLLCRYPAVTFHHFENLIGLWGWTLTFCFVNRANQIVLITKDEPKCSQQSNSIISYKTLNSDACICDQFRSLPEHQAHKWEWER